MHSTYALSMVADSVTPSRAEHSLDVVAVHSAHRDFVWRSLQRLGVRDADLADMHQEVFVVVHRKLSTFDGSSRITTWLFGICLRVATAYRRRAHIKRERQDDGTVFDESASPSESPDQALERREAQMEVNAILDEMDLEKRAVFVMFELDGLRCEDIATVTGVPLGTVYSRLRAARKQFEQSMLRRNLRRAGVNR
jgi:RNA polymerase sigma-70 factor, ECF subfamily